MTTGEVIALIKAFGSGSGGGGTGGGVLVVHENESGDTYVLDKTWQEIHDADFAVLKNSDDTSSDFSIIFGTEENDGYYNVAFTFVGSGEPVYYATTSASGYPSLSQGPK